MVIVPPGLIIIPRAAALFFQEMSGQIFSGKHEKHVNGASYQNVTLG
jgi:hypothetical protein